MYATVGQVKVDPGQRGRRRASSSRSVVIPRAKGLAGFQGGHWARVLGGDVGYSLMLFDTEANARAAADQVAQGPSAGRAAGPPATFVSVDACEVIAAGLVQWTLSWCYGRAPTPAPTDSEHRHLLLAARPPPAYPERMAGKAKFAERMASHVGEPIDAACPITHSGGTAGRIGGAVGGAVGAGIACDGQGRGSPTSRSPQFAWLGLGAEHFTLTKASAMGKPTGDPLARLAYQDVSGVELTSGKASVRADLDLADGRHLAFEIQSRGTGTSSVVVLRVPEGALLARLTRAAPRTGTGCERRGRRCRCGRSRSTRASSGRTRTAGPLGPSESWSDERTVRGVDHDLPHVVGHSGPAGHSRRGLRQGRPRPRRSSSAPTLGSDTSPGSRLPWSWARGSLRRPLLVVGCPPTGSGHRGAPAHLTLRRRRPSGRCAPDRKRWVVWAWALTFPAFWRPRPDLRGATSGVFPPDPDRAPLSATRRGAMGTTSCCWFGIAQIMCSCGSAVSSG